MQPTVEDCMELGVECAIKNFEDQFSHDGLDDEGAIWLRNSLRRIKKVRSLMSSERQKALRSEIEICFDDDESIPGDEKTDELMHVLQVKISEFEIDNRKRVNQKGID